MSNSFRMQKKKKLNKAICSLTTISIKQELQVLGFGEKQKAVLTIPRTIPQTVEWNHSE